MATPNRRRKPDSRVGSQSDERVLCRTYGHSWEVGVPRPPGMRPPTFGTQLISRCERCGMLRVDIVQSWTGDVLHRSYRPPVDYYYSKSQLGWNRARWRTELLARQLDRADAGS